MLPLVPPDGYGSPYSSASAFAASAALLADPDAEVTADEVQRFRERHRYWTGDWERFVGDGALADQVRFEREWDALRRYAADRRVQIMGDLPIYVAGASADVAAHPGLFDFSEVAGAPPDALNPQGQLWGNPLYHWPVNRAEGYRWWIERFRRSVELLDLTRIDHFRGFVASWGVEPGEETAVTGRWRRGPGLELFRAVEGELGPLPVVAEDLGVDHPGGAPPTRRARVPRDARPPVRIHRRPTERSRPCQPPGELRPLHRHPRPRPDRGLVGGCPSGGATTGARAR